MRTRLRCVLSLAFLLYASASLGQTATVIHNVNLRHDPSTDIPPIRLLHPPEVVTLLATTKTAGYFHVTTAANEEGWLWGPNVSVQATPVPTPTPTAGGPATAIDLNWPKPAPVEITFHTGSHTCGPDGTGDTATNHLKNRVDVPPDYHEVTFGAMTSLPKLPPGSPIKRSSPHWPNVAPQITPLEGVPISVVGYIFSIKPQGAEGTNCSFTGAGETDWHMPFVAHSGDAEKTAIVVELTPRVHREHTNWTAANLTPSGPKPKFRISGWLMFDPDHPAHLGTFRQTLWEIHPVTKIEVEQGGVWKDLDQP